MLPGVEAIAETLPGFETYEWNGVFLPAGTPEEIRRGLNAALNATAAEPAGRGEARGARRAGAAEHAGGIRRLPRRPVRAARPRGAGGEYPRRLTRPRADPAPAIWNASGTAGATGRSPVMTRAQGSVLVLFGLLLLLLWLVPEVPLLGFAAVLLALALRAGGEPLARRTGLPDWAGVLIVAVLVVVALGLAGWAAAGPLAEQATQLAQSLPKSLEALRGRIAGTAWGDWLLHQAAARPADGQRRGGERRRRRGAGRRQHAGGPRQPGAGGAAGAVPGGAAEGLSLRPAQPVRPAARPAGGGDPGRGRPHPARLAAGPGLRHGGGGHADLARSLGARRAAGRAAGDHHRPAELHPRARPGDRRRAGGAAGDDRGPDARRSGSSG